MGKGLQPGKPTTRADGIGWALTVPLVTLVLLLASCASAPEVSAPVAERDMLTPAQPDIFTPASPAPVIPAGAPATITLGASEYVVRRTNFPAPFDVFECFLLPARLTNHSNEPVWYYAVSPSDTWVREWVCPPNGEDWIDETFHLCALGVGFHELAPGASVSFKVAASYKYLGGQFRIGLLVYAEPSIKSTAYNVSSPEVAIR